MTLKYRDRIAIARVEMGVKRERSAPNVEK